ncbi:MAG: 30S ribosomal protein S12 methylthiotransferase RimO, partial [Bacteroidetes bacterium]
KNLVDSEHLAAHAQRHGWSIAYGLDESEGGTLILNTCGFIGDAKEESIEAILQAAAARSRGDIERLMVMGCLSQRYPEELSQEIPEVDAWYGVHDPLEILRALGCPTDDYDPTLRTPSTPSHYAFLKIAEGCDRHCAFCAIPAIRGGYRSVPIEELVQEAEQLQQLGARELILIAQELTYYGLDQRSPDLLLRLLERLEQVDGIDWLRLHYAYPTNFSEELIRWMASSPKACRYLDIPLQHISDHVLKTMQRAHGERMSRELVEKLRANIPELSLRTTLIVGYPTETEEDFRQLLDFVRQTRFDHLGVFTYSEEEGTPAASLYPDTIPEEVKQERRNEIMALQQRLSLENNARRVGQTLPVMVDHRLDEHTLIGRTEFDSPDVDGEVIIRDAEGHLAIGDLAPVRITAYSEYDLEGEPAE